MIKHSPIRLVLDVLSKKWTVEILEALFDQELRFSELERMYPDMSGKMLSRRVKELFEMGVIGKAVSNLQPLEFKYYLSDTGKLLKPLFYELAVTGSKMFRNHILKDQSLDSEAIESYFTQLYLRRS